MPCSPFVLALLGLMLGVGSSPRAKAQDGPPTAPIQHSLQLSEKGSYLELPPDVFNDFTEATVEAWVQWNAFGDRYQRVFSYGEGGRDFAIATLIGTNTLRFVIAVPGEAMKIAGLENALSRMSGPTWRRSRAAGG